MVEYRLNELAALSGVSARNIRAYRERGLLDLPRREGRSALYEDRHLAQLAMITELLRRGFTSAHIAEFFAGMRQGRDLADILGLQQAIFGTPRPVAAVEVHLDPEVDEAGRLLAHGLAEDVDGEVLVNPRLAEIISRAADPADYVRVMLRVADGVADSLDEVASSMVSALEDSVVARVGLNQMPRPDELVELRQIVTDYRALGSRVIADQLDAALQRYLQDAVAKYPADAVLGGQWEPADS